MGFLRSELFQDKEYIEAIHMVMDLKGIVCASSGSVISALPGISLM